MQIEIKLHIFSEIWPIFKIKIRLNVKIFVLNIIHIKIISFLFF